VIVENKAYLNFELITLCEDFTDILKSGFF